MPFEQVETLKKQFTDKYVEVDATVSELRRFKGLTGQVKTVNMSGRALVQFEHPVDISWYDIDPSYLKVVDKPAPKAEPAKHAAEGEKKPLPKPKRLRLRQARRRRKSEGDEPARNGPCPRGGPVQPKEPPRCECGRVRQRHLPQGENRFQNSSKRVCKARLAEQRLRHLPRRLPRPPLRPQPVENRSQKLNKLGCRARPAVSRRRPLPPLLRRPRLPHQRLAVSRFQRSNKPACRAQRVREKLLPRLRHLPHLLHPLHRLLPAENRFRKSNKPGCKVLPRAAEQQAPPSRPVLRRSAPAAPSKPRSSGCASPQPPKSCRYSDSNYWPRRKTTFKTGTRPPAGGVQRK